MNRLQRIGWRGWLNLTLIAGTVVPLLIPRRDETWPEHLAILAMCALVTALVMLLVRAALEAGQPQHEDHRSCCCRTKKR